MPDEEKNWDMYYRKIQGREPRQLLLDVLEKFPSGETYHAIDLGCGDGTETVALLARGWHVLAVDGSEIGIKLLMDQVPPDRRVRLQTQIAKFEQVALPATDLVYAGYSIPFCHPEHFPALWEKIAKAIKPGGRFAGQFFGIRDSWAIDPGMSFHSEAQVRRMLEQFEIEYFHELEEDSTATSGPKHWHVFTVIARKA